MLVRETYPSLQSRRTTFGFNPLRTGFQSRAVVAHSAALTGIPPVRGWMLVAQIQSGVLLSDGARLAPDGDEGPAAQGPGSVEKEVHVTDALKLTHRGERKAGHLPDDPLNGFIAKHPRAVKLLDE